MVVGLSASSSIVKTDRKVGDVARTSSTASNTRPDRLDPLAADPHRLELARRADRHKVNPWTHLIDLPDGRLRVLTADRRIIDLTRTESADVRVAHDLLSQHQTRAKVEATLPGRRGFLTLLHLAQLMEFSSEDVIEDGGRAARCASLHPLHPFRN